MSPTPFLRIVLESPSRLAMPIATYPGLPLAGATVRDVVTDPAAQFEVQRALQGRYGTRFVLSAMDLSAEAEAFGAPVALPAHEIPSITGRRVTSLADAGALPVPAPGDRRTSVPLESVRRLRGLPGGPFVLGGCIGPFSLAARLIGVTEALEFTGTDPALVHAVLGKCTQFLAAYVRAFQEAGADGLIMAEPAAGLLSPRSLSAFSSAYIRTIAAAVDAGRFTIILHNCGARLVHLPAILESGLAAFHFGAPMDMVAALGRVPPGIVLCGNLDPAAVFCRSTPAELCGRTEALLAATAAHPNFVISSGCDLPPDLSLASLDSFHEAVRAFVRGRPPAPPSASAS